MPLCVHFRSSTPKRAKLSISVTVTSCKLFTSWLTVYQSPAGLHMPQSPALPPRPRSPPAPIGSSRLFWWENSCGWKRLQSAFPSFSLWEDSPHAQAGRGLRGERGSSTGKQPRLEMTGRCSRTSLPEPACELLLQPQQPLLSPGCETGPADPGLGVFQGEIPGPRALVSVCPARLEPAI